MSYAYQCRYISFLHMQETIKYLVSLTVAIQLVQWHTQEGQKDEVPLPLQYYFFFSDVKFIIINSHEQAIDTDRFTGLAESGHVYGVWVNKKLKPLQVCARFQFSWRFRLQIKGKQNLDMAD